MKNIWKERWDNCPRLMMKKYLTRECDKRGALLRAVYTCGIAPLRKDAESEVREVAPGLFEICYEAPRNIEAGWKGLAVKSLVQVSKRGSKEYVKLIEVRKFFPSAEVKDDYYILEEWDKAMRVESDPTLEMIVKQLRATVG